MATGHLNPGYHNIVSDFRRTKRVVPHGSIVAGQMLRDYQDMGLEKDTLEDIRRRAREVWSKTGHMQTSYREHYGNKLQDFEPVKPRPSSPRANKPHPPLVFLSCRLHSVPGFFNPDATLGKEAYTVDALTSPEEQQMRAQLRNKYIARPATAAIQPYHNRKDFDSWSDSLPSTPTWPKNDADTTSNFGYSPAESMMGCHETERDRLLSPDLIPSMHRFMKPAGAEERNHITEIINGRRPFVNQRPKTTDIGSLRRREMQNMRRFHCKPTSKRGEFTIHPEWPPRMVHHRLNGLSPSESA